MSDLIDRQAAIDAAVKMFESWYGGSVLRDKEIRARFDALPSAQPKQLWIPCSERLPEELYETGNGIQLSNYVLVTVYNKYDDDLFVDVGYTVDGNWLSATVTNPIPIELFNVLAWMPLPEPYAEEGETHEID